MDSVFGFVSGNEAESASRILSPFEGGWGMISHPVGALIALASFSIVGVLTNKQDSVCQ
ncbi:hypothetical protein [Rufibacter sp. LB8]|uniref:hypothetical protein n=1 Tax=Rufibacter sp. LB8 TaxID=2777781 RepID=UPI00178C795E|nr:hypothetical protein [Rufibacter sp. LB8]